MEAKIVSSFPVLKDDHDLLTEYLRTAPLELQYDRKLAAQLEQQLKGAAVLGRGEFPPDVVRLGSQVVLRHVTTRQNARYTLVLPGSAEWKEGSLSVLSRLGLRTFGARRGQTITVDGPAGMRHYLLCEVFTPYA